MKEQMKMDIDVGMELSFFKRLFKVKNKGEKLYGKLSKEELMDLLQIMMADQSFSIDVRDKIAQVIHAYE